MEPTLMVIGLNHRTAPAAVRERFWIEEGHRRDALRELSGAEGIEEIAILATCCRTEFLIWAADPTLAVNSLLHFLTDKHGLKLSEWEHFYRLLDQSALEHVFQVASGLDSTALGESGIADQVNAAWQQAKVAGSCGAFLDTVLNRALSVAQRVKTETTFSVSRSSIPQAAAALAREILGSLQDKKILLIGTGEASELCARHLAEQGAVLTIVSHTREEAKELAQKVNGVPVALEQRWTHIVQADLVISNGCSPRMVLTRQDAQTIAAERENAPLIILDLAMPRSVDPEVRRVDGVLLCDLNSLDRVARQAASERSVATAEAEKIIAFEVQAFHGRLRAETAVSTILALRRRLDEICRQELESFTHEHGPFSREQDQAIHAITTKVIQKIASSLARELKGLPEKEEQEQVTAVIEKLFHLNTPTTALAGASSRGDALAPAVKRAPLNVH